MEESPETDYDWKMWLCPYALQGVHMNDDEDKNTIMGNKDTLMSRGQMISGSLCFLSSKHFPCLQIL